jgi:hypothetical protein
MYSMEMMTFNIFEQYGILPHRVWKFEALFINVYSGIDEVGISNLFMILDDASCPHHLQLCFISLLLP